MASGLRISSRKVMVGEPITQGFESYLLDQERLGKQLLTFEHLGGDAFHVLLGEVGTVVDSELQDISVAPWRLYIFNQRNIPVITAGKMLFVPRLVTDYTDVYHIDDPVELVDITNGVVYGTATVVGVGKRRLRDVDFASVSKIYPYFRGRFSLRRYLQSYYSQRVSDNTVIATLLLRATSNIGDPSEKHTSVFDLFRNLLRVVV